MKPEIKQLWINALRSGKYQQGTGCLRKEDKYCCLGVLLDCYLDERNESWVPVETNFVLQGLDSATTYYHRTKEDDCLFESFCFLPRYKDFLNWTGDIPTEKEDHLVELNDLEGLPFEVIARWIEENL